MDQELATIRERDRTVDDPFYPPHVTEQAAAGNRDRRLLLAEVDRLVTVLSDLIVFIEPVLQVADHREPYDQARHVLDPYLPTSDDVRGILAPAPERG